MMTPTGSARSRARKLRPNRTINCKSFIWPMKRVGFTLSAAIGALLLMSSIVLISDLFLECHCELSHKVISDRTNRRNLFVPEASDEQIEAVKGEDEIKVRENKQLASSFASSSFVEPPFKSAPKSIQKRNSNEPPSVRSQQVPVCQVNDGEGVAILEIEESRGSDMSQVTNPAELPISGSVEAGEIELKIESEAHKYFRIQNKSLKLTRPLDRDAIIKENSTQILQQPISSNFLQISCIDKRKDGSSGKKVIIPVLVKVLDLNDQAPKFTQSVYSVQVNELAPVGTIILDQIAYALDLDSANNGQVEYSLLGQIAVQMNSPSSSTSIIPATSPAWQDKLAGRSERPINPVTSQRLIQRTPQTSQPSTITTTTTSTTPTSATTQASQSSSSGSELSTSTISSSAMPSDSSALSTIGISITEMPPVGSEESRSQLLASRIREINDKEDEQSTKSSATPTINLNSEPILNEPIEEIDEDESDEALLASMNANSTDSEQPEESDSNSAPGFMMPDALDKLPLLPSERIRFRLLANSKDDKSSLAIGGHKRRRRKRRHLAAQATTTTTTTTTMKIDEISRGPRPSQSTADGSNNLPWTNLMILGDPNEESSKSSLKTQEELTLEEADQESNEYFELELAPRSGRPIIKLKKQLDYETKRVHRLILVATDRAGNKNERLSSRAQIIVRVTDGDDQAPVFVLDQVGCATGSLPHYTSPAPVQKSASQISLNEGDLGTSTTSSLSDLDLLQVDSRMARKQTKVLKPSQLGSELGVVSTPMPNSSQRLRSFKISEENFDFGDTLALDDTPLDDHQQTVRTFAVESQRLDSGQVTNLDKPMQQLATAGSVTTTVGPKLRSSDLMADYLCLSPNEHQQRSMQQTTEYFATVISGDSDYLLRVAPQSIKARDRDELNAPIRYAFINGTPANYGQYFHINPLDATIKQISPVDRTQVDEFVLYVKAEEQTQNKLFSVAKLIIDVLPTDKNPPLLVPNSYSGLIEENSPIGTRVFAQNVKGGESSEAAKSQLRITVIDSDSADKSIAKAPSQSSSVMNSKQHTSYEFETTSDAFKVDRDGFVVVNKYPLDRDAPNQATHTFQVTAHRAGLVSAKSTSSPISLNITLLDLNDNPPLLLNSSLGSIQMTANSRGGVQQLTKLLAEDRDSAPENSRRHFSILHVSNNGAQKFRIEEESGRIESLGKFQAGEQFSLTVQVADELQRSSQGILDVQVVPGANTAGPQFLVDDSERDNSRGYSIEVNEAVALNSIVLQVRAQDPENDPISYSIIDGNINGDFSMNSKTGALQVAKRLDREEISAYKLIVQARDSGGLATSRPIHITIADSNDQNPVFNQESYVFVVEEGKAQVSNEQENSLGLLLGRVSAQDGDEGENGRVTYSLMSLQVVGADFSETPEQSNSTPKQQPQKSLFSIDEQTGDIRLMKPLDYEQAKSHTLLVVARDNGENPRSSSASVQIKVLDRQDELPYFERYHIESRLDENLANARVALVQARDPDSVAQISYVLLAGDPNLFRVDPQTGLVSTVAGLDYEEARLHTLLVGTNESLAAGLDVSSMAQRLAGLIVSSGSGGGEESNQRQQQQHHQMAQSQRWPLTRIDVFVNDLNDNAPEFDSPNPLPVRVQDSAPLGTLLEAKIKAHDLDGSAPNNQVRYELVVASSNSNSNSAHSGSQLEVATSEKCAQLFLIDPTSGQISVRSDLKRASLSECQLVIRAHDLPSSHRDDDQVRLELSSTSMLTVFIDHLAEISASSMISFADNTYTVEIDEHAPANSLVKLLPIINKPKVAFPMSCEILSGNELNKFQLIENEQRDCELRTRDNSLDFELRQRYNLIIKLNTIGSSSRATMAQVQVNILDKNDNRPQFGKPARYGHLTANKFLAAIGSESPGETQVIQLRASDLDSAQANGLISYELLNEQELEGRFKVDPVDGIIRTSRPVEDIPSSRLPIRLRLLARDNPEQTNDSLDSTAEIVLNLVQEHNRICLVLKDTPAGRVLENRDELLAILQERTGLISGLERVESLKVQRNATPIVEADVSGADVWFYLIEPGSLRIVSSDDSRLKSTLFDTRAQNSLADMIGQNLGFAKARVRLPYSLIYANANSLGSSGGTAANLLFGTFRSNSSDRLAPILIMIALFIAVISAIVVVYQCGSAAGWSESNQHVQHQHQHQHQTLPQAQFSKEKFLFSAPPPPPSSSGHFNLNGGGAQTPLGSQLNHRLSDQYANVRSSLNDPLQQQQQQQDQEALYQLGSAAAQAKEYETQMLKMSVLFDDNQSFDEQNLQMLSKNLV